MLVQISTQKKEITSILILDIQHPEYFIVSKHPLNINLQQPKKTKADIKVCKQLRLIYAP